MSIDEIQLLADHVTLKTWRSYERVSDRADRETWRDTYPFLVGFAAHIWCWLFDQTENPLSDHLDDFLKRVCLGSQGAYEELFGVWDAEAAEASFEEEVISAYMDVDYLWEVYRENYDRRGVTALDYAVHESELFGAGHPSEHAFRLAGGIIIDAMMADAANMETQSAER
jgi:hypothetical protein